MNRILKNEFLAALSTLVRKIEDQRTEGGLEN